MGALSQALQIIFEVQRKKSNENSSKKKNKLPTHKTFFFLVPLFGPLLLLSKLLTFSFLVHFK
jgi:hypothetical protein